MFMILNISVTLSHYLAKVMFHLNGSHKYYLYPLAVDMRKSFYTLSGIVTSSMNQNVLGGGVFIFVNRNQTIKADPLTWQTTQPDVFAGGDVVTGPKFAIDAIAAGKQAAISIHRFVQPGQSLIIGRSHRVASGFYKSQALEMTPR